MSSLRSKLKRPHPYLALVALSWGLAFADMMRQPAEQATARAYLSAVGAYQRTVSPRLSCVRCRMSPSCSRYSVQAVQRHGMLEGWRLTAARLWRCEQAVASGIADPVP